MHAPVGGPHVPLVQVAVGCPSYDALHMATQVSPDAVLLQSFHSPCSTVGGPLIIEPGVCKAAPRSGCRRHSWQLHHPHAKQHHTPQCSLHHGQWMRMSRLAHPQRGWWGRRCSLQCTQPAQHTAGCRSRSSTLAISKKGTQRSLLEERLGLACTCRAVH